MELKDQEMMENNCTDLSYMKLNVLNLLMLKQEQNHVH